MLEGSPEPLSPSFPNTSRSSAVCVGEALAAVGMATKSHSFPAASFAIDIVRSFMYFQLQRPTNCIKENKVLVTDLKFLVLAVLEENHRRLWQNKWIREISTLPLISKLFPILKD